MNTTEIKRPSNLTEEDRAETTVLIEAFKKIPDELGKKIALAYLEGFTATHGCIWQTGPGLSGWTAATPTSCSRDYTIMPMAVFVIGTAIITGLPNCSLNFIMIYITRMQPPIFQIRLFSISPNFREIFL